MPAARPKLRGEHETATRRVLGKHHRAERQPKQLGPSDAVHPKLSSSVIDLQLSTDWWLGLVVWWFGGGFQL